MALRGTAQFRSGGVSDASIKYGKGNAAYAAVLWPLRARVREMRGLGEWVNPDAHQFSLSPLLVRSASQRLRQLVVAKRNSRLCRLQRITP